MAKQAGESKITGTIDDLCFYEMDGQYHVRMKSSLTGKKFWKDKAFDGSRKSCNRFAEGNKIASKIYKMIDEDKRDYRLFCFLKRRAILLVKDGKSVDEAEELLIDYLVEFGTVNEKRKEHREAVKPVFEKKCEEQRTPSTCGDSAGNEIAQDLLLCPQFLLNSDLT